MSALLLPLPFAPQTRVEGHVPHRQSGNTVPPEAERISYNEWYAQNLIALYRPPEPVRPASATPGHRDDPGPQLVTGIKGLAVPFGVATIRPAFVNGSRIGRGSTVGRVRVMAGAFDASIRRAAAGGRPVQLLALHDTTHVLATTADGSLVVRSCPNALRVEVRGADAIRYIRTHPELQFMSAGFDVQEWRPALFGGGLGRDVIEADLLETSLVDEPCFPGTSAPA